MIFLHVKVDMPRLARVQEREMVGRADPSLGTFGQRVHGALIATEHMRSCRCGFGPETGLMDILTAGAGCTSPNWVCARLVSIRKHLGSIGYVSTMTKVDKKQLTEDEKRTLGIAVDFDYTTAIAQEEAEKEAEARAEAEELKNKYGRKKK